MWLQQNKVAEYYGGILMIRELKNFLTSVTMVIVLLLAFIKLNQYELVYSLAGVIYKVEEVLGLVQTDLYKGPYLPILGTNIFLFILLNVIFGYLAYILINKRGAVYRGVFYGIAMVAIFFILAY